MQKLLRLFLFFFFSICGFAKNNISLSYMFLDTNTQLPIESATVFFLMSKTRQLLTIHQPIKMDHLKF